MPPDTDALEYIKSKTNFVWTSPAPSIIRTNVFPGCQIEVAYVPFEHPVLHLMMHGGGGNQKVEIKHLHSRSDIVNTIEAFVRARAVDYVFSVLRDEIPDVNKVISSSIPPQVLKDIKNDLTGGAIADLKRLIDFIEAFDPQNGKVIGCALRGIQANLREILEFDSREVIK